MRDLIRDVSNYVRPAK